MKDNGILSIVSHLYAASGTYINRTDFSNALKVIGITSGNVIFVHSDIRVFGKINSQEPVNVFSSLVDVLETSVGMGGTLIMPTFSYTFCSSGIFNWEESRSEVGALTEYFRHQPNVIRSIHPIFSVAARGKCAERITAVDMDAFGQRSAFAHMRKLDATVLFFGAPFRSCTFLHHIEQLCHVPYRFMKTFSGVTKKDGKTSPTICTYFVRPLDGSAEYDFSTLESIVKSSGKLRSVSVGNGIIMAISVKDLVAITTDALEKNPLILLEKSS